MQLSKDKASLTLVDYRNQNVDVIQVAVYCPVKDCGEAKRILDELANGPVKFKMVGEMAEGFDPKLQRKFCQFKFPPSQCSQQLQALSQHFKNIALKNKQQQKISPGNHLDFINKVEAMASQTQRQHYSVSLTGNIM